VAAVPLLGSEFLPKLNEGISAHHHAAAPASLGAHQELGRRANPARYRGQTVISQSGADDGTDPKVQQPRDPRRRGAARAALRHQDACADMSAKIHAIRRATNFFAGDPGQREACPAQRRDRGQGFRPDSRSCRQGRQIVDVWPLPWPVDVAAMRSAQTSSPSA